jgi:hypothetical protein
MTDTVPAPTVDWRTDADRKCLHCKATRREIAQARGDLSCGIADAHTSELAAEFPRHRFKPWTEKEVAARRQEEQHIAAQMGDMVAWWNREGRHADV